MKGPLWLREEVQSPKKPRFSLTLCFWVIISPGESGGVPIRGRAPLARAERLNYGHRVQPQTDLATPLILVVDDYEDAREMYAEYLELSGFRTAQARTGEEALEKASTLLPDVVLMDLSLPVMDGCEATARLKSDPRTQHIPVVALTGHSEGPHSDEARRAGCDAFVVKPCMPDTLVSELQRVLGHPA